MSPTLLRYRRAKASKPLEASHVDLYAKDVRAQYKNFVNAWLRENWKDLDLGTQAVARQGFTDYKFLDPYRQPGRYSELPSWKQANDFVANRWRFEKGVDPYILFADEYTISNRDTPSVDSLGLPGASAQGAGTRQQFTPPDPKKAKVTSQGSQTPSLSSAKRKGSTVSETLERARKKGFLGPAKNDPIPTDRFFNNRAVVPKDIRQFLNRYWKKPLQHRRKFGVQRNKISRYYFRRNRLRARTTMAFRRNYRRRAPSRFRRRRRVFKKSYRRKLMFRRMNRFPARRLRTPRNLRSRMMKYRKILYDHSALSQKTVIHARWQSTLKTDEHLGDMSLMKWYSFCPFLKNEFSEAASNDFIDFSPTNATAIGGKLLRGGKFHFSLCNSSSISIHIRFGIVWSKKEVDQTILKSWIGGFGHSFTANFDDYEFQFKKKVAARIIRKGSFMLPPGGCKTVFMKIPIMNVAPIAEARKLGNLPFFLLGTAKCSTPANPGKMELHWSINATSCAQPS